MQEKQGLKPGTPHLCHLSGEECSGLKPCHVSTFFGKTAELVRTAKTARHLERIILQIVQYMVGLVALLYVAVLGYAVIMHISLDQMLPSALVLLIASVPVALPASFTLTTSLGAQELVRSGNCLSTGISVYVYLTNPSMSGEQPESDSNRPVTGKSLLMEKMWISSG